MASIQTRRFAIHRFGIVAVAIGAIGVIGVIGALAVVLVTANALTSTTDSRPMGASSTARSIPIEDRAFQTLFLEWNTQLPTDRGILATTRDQAFQTLFLEWNTQLPTDRGIVVTTWDQARFMDENTQLPSQGRIATPRSFVDMRFMDENTQLPTGGNMPYYPQPDASPLADAATHY